jgi:DNA-binding response OmpR family regulator
MAWIAVVEDNADLLDDVMLALERAGHQASGFGTAAAFWAGVQAQWPDLVVLDLGLPDADGLAVAQCLREQAPTTAVVMLTARTALQDRLLGWQQGADAYLCKPVHLCELVAVVEAQLRRRPEASAGEWVIDSFHLTLNPPDGEPLLLSHAECQVLLALAQAPEQKARRRELVEAMGANYLDFDERRLENIMSRLRSKIAAAGIETAQLRAVRGLGYTFTAPLRRRQHGALGRQ